LKEIAVHSGIPVAEPSNKNTHFATAPEAAIRVPVRPVERFRSMKNRVWIDLDNSPHVPMFLPIIEELQKRGVELVLTARNMYQVCDLLEYYGLSCQVIGGHWGKNKVLKVVNNCVRVAQLLPTIRSARPDLAISHGSRAQLLTAKLLGIPSIMMHDYEHNIKTGFIEAEWVLMPDVIPDVSMTKKPERVLLYPGIKEDIYIPSFRPDPSILTQLGISPDDLVVTVRPPATEAHYHTHESDVLFAETMRLLSSRPHVRAVTLPRNSRQTEQLRSEWKDLIASGCMLIPDSAVNGLNMLWFSDLAVSGGGTMNREAAALGVPVYSIFRGKIGAVDRYLADQGRLTLLETPEDVRTKIKLERWNRPSKPEDRKIPTLQCVVDSIVSALRGEISVGQPSEVLQ
jgi:uncharacterized protein